ncbi:MAG: hypothetical protein HOF10_13125, partial [Chloroflexi bacterium]|nr:hypothetical protein [Chloroflexota bacterium]
MNINLISKTEWKEGLTFKLSFGKQDPIPGESRPTAGSILLMGKNLGEVSLGLENKINAETIR